MTSEGTMGDDTWKRCSTCKKPIAFSATYFVCSVSTCNRKRTGMVFCSVECWDQHLPMMRHREAWAVEEKAPTRAQAEAADRGGSGGGGGGGGSAPPKEAPAKSTRRSEPITRRRIIGEGPPPGPREVLVVVSRFKEYVRQVHGMNTSDGVFDVISDELRRIATRAAQNAKDAERKTLLDRDFDFLKRG